MVILSQIIGGSLTTTHCLIEYSVVIQLLCKALVLATSAHWTLRLQEEFQNFTYNYLIVSLYMSQFMILKRKETARIKLQNLHLPTSSLCYCIYLYVVCDYFFVRILSEIYNKINNYRIILYVIPYLLRTYRNKHNYEYKDRVIND